jgi:hypothetical protein
MRVKGVVLPHVTMKKSLSLQSERQFTSFFSRDGPKVLCTLRKIQILGVRLDGIVQQPSFLIDEGQTIGPDGKGPNGPDAVLSIIDWTLQNQVNQTPALSIHSVIFLANCLQ